MATASYKGRLEFQDISGGVLASAAALSVANNADWDRLFFTSTSVTRTRETDDITENTVAREMDPVLFTWSLTVDFTMKKSAQGGYTAQQLLFNAELEEDRENRLYVRLVADPSGTVVSGHKQPAANDEAEWGEVIVTGITTNRETAGVVRVSATLQGTGPLERADLTA